MNRRDRRRAAATFMFVQPIGPRGDEPGEGFEYARLDQFEVWHAARRRATWGLMNWRVT